MLARPIRKVRVTDLRHSSMDYAAARQNMVNCQILPNRVTNPYIVDGMLDLPREKFVPVELEEVAYLDGSLPLGSGRFLMEPMLVARLLEVVAPDPDDVAMVVGCASGYLSALLAKIVSTVVAVESDKAFTLCAGETFKQLSIDNIVLVEGKLNDGYSKQCPYDVIVFDGAVTEIPDTIIEQLANGGRLAAVVIGTDGIGRAQMLSRHGDTISSRDMFEAGTPLLPGFMDEIKFSF